MRTALLVWGCTILLLVVLLPFGGRTQAWWARRAAARELLGGDVGAAQEWLAWMAEFRPKDGRADVIRAACFRYRRQGDDFAKALRSAEENGAPAELIEREASLARIQSGDVSEDAEIELAAMIDAGAAAHDVCTAYVYGFLSRKEFQRAKNVLDVWAGDSPEEANIAYMRGIYWRSLGERALAEEKIKAVVDEQPRHEMARTALAELLEEQGDLERALAERIELAKCCPSNKAARLNLARLLRKTGHIDEAEAVAAPLAAAAEVSAEVLWELGEIALESGDYQEALRRFQRSDSKQAYDHGSVFASATALALQGDTNRAEILLARVKSSATAFSLHRDTQAADRLFGQLNAVYSWLHRALHLQAILRADPNNRSASRELTALSRAPPFTSTLPNTLEGTAQSENPQAAESGSELYNVHCTVCHGADGAGNGPAARHLYPRPKNLRSGNYRLISTRNGVPSLKDVERTLERGIPGTSMQSFENLSKSHRTLLAEEVLRLLREGIRDEVVLFYSQEDEELTEDEIRDIVEELTTPGEVITPAEIGLPTPQAIARGKEMYDRMGCAHCHGDDGTGPSDTLLIDDEGRLTTSCDLAHEPLKGGDEPQAIYLRLLLGMPGTPHPACPSLSEAELVDFVQFCRSLRREPIKSLTNYKRAIRATRGLVEGPLREVP